MLGRFLVFPRVCCLSAAMNYECFWFEGLEGVLNFKETRLSVFQSFNIFFLWWEWGEW